MFEKFTEGAIKVIMLAQEEARRMGHPFVGTEQLLLGVIGQRYGIGARALKQLKVSLKKTRKEIELYIGRGTGFVGSEIPFTPRAKRVLEMSMTESRDLNQQFVATEHLLLALINESDGVAMRTLNKLRVDSRLLRETIFGYIKELQDDIIDPDDDDIITLTPREKNESPTPTLDEFSDNVTKDAMSGKLDPVIGREKEMNDLIVSLARRTKNNPVLLGEAGVGKTAVAEGLAQLILDQNVPEFLNGSILMALDLGSVLAGTKYRGEFEERLKNIVDEVQDDPSVIVIIDEIHTLVGAGAAEGAVDAANILKPALARGKFRCIGATTNDEYKKYIERDPALARRFQAVVVEQPSVGTTIKILHGLKSKFEIHHTLNYSRKAIEQAAILADKYIPDRFLPDKAIDVLDEAGARVRLENREYPKGLKLLMQELKISMNEKYAAMNNHDFRRAEAFFDRELEIRIHIKIMKQSAIANKLQGFTREHFDKVLEADVSNVIAYWTGVPVNKITGNESEKLLNMENTIRERIIGQGPAVTSVSNAIRRARVGLRNPNRPIASFIFAGPTGVGKTELTKVVTEFMFDDENSMVRLDMSEFMEKHTVAKLIGSPPGYVGYNEGGQLTESVRAKPYSVVLLDEVEKAHPDVFNILLQILDDGRLTDSKGRVIDFTNTLIVMTTNLGARIIERESGIKPKPNGGNDGLKLVVNDNPFRVWSPEAEIIKSKELLSRVNDLVKDELKNFFRPEFLNRIDEIIVFSHLSKPDIWDISKIMINQLVERLQGKGLELIVTDPVRALLVDEGNDPLYGARPLRRVIMHYLEDELAELCLSSNLKSGTRITVLRKTLTQLKKELKKTKRLDEIRALFEKTYISPSSNSNIRQVLLKTSKNFLSENDENKDTLNLKTQDEKTKITNDDDEDTVEDTVLAAQFLSDNEIDENDSFEAIDRDCENPFAVPDNEIYTNQIVIILDKSALTEAELYEETRFNTPEMKKNIERGKKRNADRRLKKTIKEAKIKKEKAIMDVREKEHAKYDYRPRIKRVYGLGFRGFFINLFNSTIRYALDNLAFFGVRLFKGTCNFLTWLFFGFTKFELKPIGRPQLDIEYLLAKNNPAIIDAKKEKKEKNQTDNKKNIKNSEKDKKRNMWDFRFWRRKKS